MKILLLAPQPFYTQRGTPIAIRNLASVLGEAGHHIDMLTYPGGSDVQLENTRIFRLWKIPLMGEVPVGFSIQKLLYDFLMFFAVFWKVLSNRYDVIHAVEESVYIALIFAPLKGSRVIYDMDSSMADQLLEKWPWLGRARGFLVWFEGLAIRYSTRVIAVCQALVDKALSYGSNTPIDLLTDTVLEIENDSGEQAEDLRSLIPDNHQLLLYVGNLEHYQGVDTVIEAMVEVENNVSFLVIGGIAEDIRRCQALANRLNVDRQIQFTGPRPVQLLQEYLEQADCLISPRTKGVNTPMKIYSYLGAGVPVIATDIASHTQALNDKNACLVEPSPSSIASGINKIVSDQDYAKELASQAKQDADELYSYQAFKDHLINIYKALENDING
jgi:glycosyltransferase involved in cell wall biosynthesis